jgi:hypothetical protein
MTNYISTTDTAKLIRAALKAAFPGVKFSVKSDQYAGGSSIRVKYTDGPVLAEVEAIAKEFVGSVRDYDSDCNITRAVEVDGVRTVYGPDYVFVSQDVSPARKAAIDAALRAMSEGERSRLVFKLRLPSYMDLKPDGFDWGALIHNVAVNIAA